MDFPEGKSLEEAFAMAEAEALLKQVRERAAARLSAATAPDNRCEDWRFGRPLTYAAELLAAMAPGRRSAGRVQLQAPEDITDTPDDEWRMEEEMMPTLGSDAILAAHVQRFGEGVCLFLEEDTEYPDPIVITYETDSLFTPSTFILAAPGAKARIIERHITHGSGIMVTTRCVRAMQGAELSLELQEQGSGESRCMNISSLAADQAVIRHLTTHENHAWAREETVAEITGSTEEQRADIRLYSANRLAQHQVLDQHTRQIHLCGHSFSDLLYKNVADDHAAATFAGMIYVAPGAHRTDAYQANRNMLLSEKATVHSLPGLEILADHVRCSHGSASSPMDEEQLFYLLSRGIPRHEAQMLVADGFLEDAVTRFRTSES